MNTQKLREQLSKKCKTCQKDKIIISCNECIRLTYEQLLSEAAEVIKSNYEIFESNACEDCEPYNECPDRSCDVYKNKTFLEKLYGEPIEEIMEGSK